LIYSKNDQREAKIYKFIEKFILENGVSPSLNEISNGVGLPRMTTYDWLQRMSHDGKIISRKDTGRSYMLHGILYVRVKNMDRSILKPAARMVLEFLERYITTNRIVPSYREVIKELDITSTSVLHNYYNQLEKSGFIQFYGSGTSKSIILTEYKYKKANE